MSTARKAPHGSIRGGGIATAFFLVFGAPAILAAAGTAQVSGLSAGREPTEGKLLRSSAPRAGHYIVVLKEELDTEGRVQMMAASQVQSWSGALTATYGGQVDDVYTHALRGFSATMTEAEAEALSMDSAVAFVEEDSIVSLAVTQIDPPSWGLDRIDERFLPLDGAYRYGRRGVAVNVYVIDSGIRYSHQEFQGRAVPLFGPGGVATDCNGHGTHVAGTIGGATVGVAKGVTLYGVRVFDCSGSGTASGVAAGVDYVTSYDFNNHYGQPSVANMSIQGPPSEALDLAVANSIAFGITYVVAAGNNNVDAVFSSPGRVAAAITVAASDIRDVKAGFSNHGSRVDLFAPGVDILSAFSSADNHFVLMSGTSMASPHVAGAAALYQAGHPGATPAQVRDWLVATSTVVVTGAPGGTFNGLLHVPPPPTAPTDVRAEHTCGREIRVSWSQAGTPETFAIERRPGAAGAWTEIVRIGGGARQHLDQNVELEKTYSYRLRAMDAAGDSDYSSSASATVVPISVEAVSVDPSSVVQSRTQNVTWTSAEQEEYGLFLFDAAGANPIDTTAYIPGGGADGRIVEVAASRATVHPWTVPRNLPLGRYTIRVEARDSCGGNAFALSTMFEVTTRNQTSFQTAVSSIPEGGGAAALSLLFSSADGTPSTTAASLSYETANLTAVAAGSDCSTGDYRAATGVVSFPAGTASGATRPISVAICSDALDEADERFRVELSTPSGTTLTDPEAVVVTIADDDPLPRLRIEDVELTEPVTGTLAVTLAVSLSEPSGRAVEVGFATADGTALADADYLSRSGNLAFAAGTTIQWTSFTVLADSLVEPDEFFHVRLRSPENALLEDEEAIVRIIDPPYVSVSDSSAIEGNEGESLLVFPVTLSKPSTEPILVRWLTTPLPGGAAPGIDYVEATGTLEIAPGDVGGSISVAAIGETLFEHDQSFALHLEQPGNASLFDPDARGTIWNDDLPPTVVVTGVTAEEGDVETEWTLEVAKLGPTERSFDVTWKTGDGTATAGSDYVAQTGIIRFRVGPGIPEQPEPTVSVTVFGDRVVEADEAFLVALYGNTAEPGVLLSETPVVLLNDDEPPAVRLTLSDSGVTEGHTGTKQLVFQVRVLGSPSGTVSVSWSTSTGGTATAGVDYLPASGTLSFPAGTTLATFPVTVFGDRTREKDETVFVELSGPSGATVLDGLGVGVIRDDERKGVGPAS